MGRNVVSPAIFAQRLVRWVAFRCRPPQDEHGRRYPEFFRINFSRCIFCGLCEEACPTYALQLIPDFEMSEYKRQNLVYEKEDLLISGTGKYAGYNFYRVAGVSIKGKNKGQSENESPPIDRNSLLP